MLLTIVRTAPSGKFFWKLTVKGTSPGNPLIKQLEEKKVSFKFLELGSKFPKDIYQGVILKTVLISVLKTAITLDSLNTTAK